MKKGKVISLALGHKNGRVVLKTGDSVTENDVDNFDACVRNGHIELDAEKVALKKDVKKSK